jgi:uncharacterized Zn finger protein
MGEFQSSEVVRVNLEFPDLLKRAITDTSRMFQEGNKVLKSNRINYVGIDSQDVNKIVASVTKATDRGSFPHEISIKMAESFEGWTFRCSCKAGVVGHCKHTFATLLYILQ